MVHIRCDIFLSGNISVLIMQLRNCRKFPTMARMNDIYPSYSRGNCEVESLCHIVHGYPIVWIGGGWRSQCHPWTFGKQYKICLRSSNMFFTTASCTVLHCYATTVSPQLNGYGPSLWHVFIMGFKGWSEAHSPVFLHTLLLHLLSVWSVVRHWLVCRQVFLTLQGIFIVKDKKIVKWSDAFYVIREVYKMMEIVHNCFIPI